MPSEQLDRLGRLDGADHAGQHAQHAALGAARHQAGRRRLGVQAAIARPALLGVEHRRLALEAKDRAIDIRLAEHHAGVVGQVAGREIIGAVHDHIVGPHQLEGILRRDLLLVGCDLDMRVQIAQASLAPTRSCGRRSCWCRGRSGAGGCSHRPRRNRPGRYGRRRPPPDTAPAASPARRCRSAARCLLSGVAARPCRTRA